jgi:hypothetical protein
MNELIPVKDSKFDLSERKKIFRESVMEVQKEVAAIPGSLVAGTPEYKEVCPLKHTFADGLYIREIFMPKGLLMISKIHKVLHPYFILSGEVSVLTEDGIVRIKAPFQGLTKPGTIRVIYMHEDTVWLTVHATTKTDPDEIEREVTTTDFDELKEQFDIQSFVDEVTV